MKNTASHRIYLMPWILILFLAVPLAACGRGQTAIAEATPPVPPPSAVPPQEESQPSDELSSLQLPLFPGAMFSGNAQSSAEDARAAVEKHAQGLGVPWPSEWEYYLLPSSASVKEVADFYTRNLGALGYVLADTAVGEDEIYVYQYHKDGEVLMIQVWGPLQGRDNAILIFKYRV